MRAGCERIAAGAWRQLAAAWPGLAVVRLGGCSTCSEAALKALPHILPCISHADSNSTAGKEGGGGRADAADVATDGPSSWEDVASSDSDSEPDQAASAAAAPSGRLKQLRALMWADVPDAALALVAQRCPRVLVNPPVRRADVASGRLPAELDAAVPLDEPLMALVGPAALQVGACVGCWR